MGTTPIIPFSIGIIGNPGNLFDNYVQTCHTLCVVTRLIPTLLLTVVMFSRDQLARGCSGHLMSTIDP